MNDFKLNPLKIEEIFFCLCETYVLEILKSHFPNSLFKTSSSGLRLKWLSFNNHLFLYRYKENKK